MQTTTFLSEEDHSLLSELLYHRRPGMLPVPGSYNSLSALLANSRQFPLDAPELENRVGLNDSIRLVSPNDESDFYEPSIVLPAEADLSLDRLSVLTPIGFAVIGRKTGETVSWETPRDRREMRIDSVRKLELPRA